MHGKLLPNYCMNGRPLVDHGGVIIHYFSCINVDPDDPYDLNNCRDLFKDLNRPMEEREHYMLDGAWPVDRQFASAHFMIGRCGTTWQLVPSHLQAWHAGFSRLDGREACNSWTMGIELIGDRHSGFTREQYMELARLLIDLENEHGIPRNKLAGHDHVRYEAIVNDKHGRRAAYKYDPSGEKDGTGENFDWLYLGKAMNDIKKNPAGVAGLEMLDGLEGIQPGKL